MEQQKVIFSDQLQSTINQAIADCPHDRLFVLTDETTSRLCLPVIAGYESMAGVYPIVISATDQHKNLESLSHVWSELQQHGATRHSLLVNLGGGMVTDLGGFAASTFKRGLHFINIPTTLLAMVDASVGGKTGINFGGLKNEIGVFRNADSVILDTTFLKTLDRENLLSGYAEMLKHALIDCEDHWAEILGNLEHLECIDYLEKLTVLVARSVAVKQRIVTEDPTERGLRKALNLGHTAGHAFESLALERTPILHGYAVAYGLVVELYLSHMKTGFPADRLRQTVQLTIRSSCSSCATTRKTSVPTSTSPYSVALVTYASTRRLPTTRYKRRSTSTASTDASVTPENNYYLLILLITNRWAYP